MNIIILGILHFVNTVVSLVAFVMVLIKLFKKEGALKGILGLICSIYAFVWGWMNHAGLNITKLMAIWSITIAVGILLQGATFLGLFGEVVPPQVATQAPTMQPGPKEVPKAAPQPSQDTKAMPRQRDAAIDAQLDLKGFGQIGAQRFPLVPSTP
jgi:hypothetical protein